MTALQERLAALEGAQACIETASGMSAILACAMSLLKSGDHVVTSHSIFGSTVQLFTNIRPLRRRNHVCFAHRPGGVARRSQVQHPAVLRRVSLQPPTEVSDIRALAAIAHAHNGTHFLFPTDATLGIEGLPQSGTGQASLFCGFNAPKFVGKHFGPFPYTKTIPVLKKDNILVYFKEKYKSSYFANAYPKVFFDYVNSGRTRLGVTTLTCQLAGIRLNRVSDVGEGRALTAELTNQRWIQRLGYKLKVIKPITAARRLLRIAEKYKFTLYEYYLSDHIGHLRLANEFEKLFTEMDEFLFTLLDEVDSKKMTLIICSDHGNLEVIFRDGWERRYEAMKAGADDYLLKPAPSRELLIRLELLLRRFSEIDLGGEGTALRGAVELVGAPAVLQICHLNQLTGVLGARRGSQSLRIAFRHGQVIAAIGPDHDGPLVVYDFVGWPQGQFEFDRDAVIEGTPIAAEFNALLLEGCRRLDERRRGRPVDSGLGPEPPLTHEARLA